MLRLVLCDVGHFLFFLFWHAPLEMCSAKRRHQSPEWTVLSHINCFIQVYVVWFQALLDSLHPRSTRASWWSPPVLQGGWYCIVQDIIMSLMLISVHLMWVARLAVGGVRLPRSSSMFDCNRLQLRCSAMYLPILKWECSLNPVAGWLWDDVCWC